jgi:hypothetical protein
VGRRDLLSQSSGGRKIKAEGRDGTAIDLKISPAATVRAYPAIVEALSGHDFSFDAKDVAPHCSEPYLSILARGP